MAALSRNSPLMLSVYCLCPSVHSVAGGLPAVVAPSCPSPLRLACHPSGRQPDGHPVAGCVQGDVVVIPALLPIRVHCQAVWLALQPVRFRLGLRPNALSPLSIQPRSRALLRHCEAAAGPVKQKIGSP